MRSGLFIKFTTLANIAHSKQHTECHSQPEGSAEQRELLTTDLIDFTDDQTGNIFWSNLVEFTRRGGTDAERLER